MPHGLANSILLPHVMRFNRKYCAGRYALVAGAMGLDIRRLDLEEASAAAEAAVGELSRRLVLPLRLRDCTVPEDGLEKAATLSLMDGAVIYNPRKTGKAEKVLTLFREAW